MSSYPSQVNSTVMNIDKFSGLNLSTHASRINDIEASFMENFYIKENGVLSKRRGIKNVINIGDNYSILGMIEYQDYMVVGTKRAIFKIDSQNNKTIIYNYDAVDETKWAKFCNMFILNGMLYMLDGQSFKQYDGTTLRHVHTVAYIPTLFIATSPNGDGTPLEQWNLLSDSFRQSFSADGTSKNYLLCLGQFTTVSVVVDGVTKVPSTDYVSEYKKDTNRIEIRFTEVPPKGVDNIVVTAKYEATMPFYKEKIEPCRKRVNECKVYSFYGGQNDTRLLLAGQDSVFYRSDVYNPAYFPENYYQSVGEANEKITGFVTQYDYCVVLKERSIYHTRFELLEDGTSTYTTKPINSQFGCINSNTVQLINNSPMFLTRKGVATVNQTQLRDERNVSIVSERVHNEVGLLKEDHTKAISIDYDNKYMLAYGNKVYIYDYLNDCFYIWKFDNLDFNITYMTSYNDSLYLGTEKGNVYKYRDEEEAETTSAGALIYDDDFISGTMPVKSAWKSKLFSFEDFNRYKQIEKLFISLSPSESTSADISYITNDNNEVVVGYSSSNLFTYDKLSYDKFSYLSTFHPTVDSMKIKLKKIIFFQLVIKNYNNEESLDVYNIGFKYKIQKEVKA